MQCVCVRVCDVSSCIQLRVKWQNCAFYLHRIARMICVARSARGIADIHMLYIIYTRDILYIYYSLLRCRNNVLAVGAYKSHWCLFGKACGGKATSAAAGALDRQLRQAEITELSIAIRT